MDIQLLAAAPICIARSSKNSLTRSVATSTKTMIVALFFSIVSISIVQAQPVSQQTDLVQLQKQLVALQSQLAALQPQDNPFGEDDRVRTIGSQKPKAAPAPRQDDSLHIRLYDLSDIFAVSPNYPAVMPNDVMDPTTVFQNQFSQMVGSNGGGGFGGGGGGVFRVPPANPRTPVPKQGSASGAMQSATISMTRLVEAIQNTVSPDDWEDSGGDAKIELLSNTLLITANRSMHAQTSDLINLFREHFGKRRTVSVQTYWIRANAGQAADLLDAKSAESIGAGVVNQEKWNTFVDLARTEKRFAYSATLTGHNNQTLHALSGRQRQLTLDATPFEATKSSLMLNSGKGKAINLNADDPFKEDTQDNPRNENDVDLINRTHQVIGFKPIRQTVHDGAAIQITPLATRGGNFVVVDLHAKVNEFIDAEPESKKSSIFVRLNEKERIEVELDDANYVSYRLNTTVRCPKEQVVLAGGMTYDPNADSDVPNLYLFVKASVHTITEDESDWKRESNSTAAESK